MKDPPGELLPRHVMIPHETTTLSHGAVVGVVVRLSANLLLLADLRYLSRSLLFRSSCLLRMPDLTKQRHLKLPLSVVLRHIIR